MGKLGGQENFDRALQDGVIEPAGEMATGGGGFAGNAAGAIAAIQANKSAGGVEW
jgi:hypothetical protein